MSARSSRSQEIDIETGITPAVKDLRSLFEQKAKTFPPNPTASRRPGDKSPLLSPRQSPGRRSSPTPSNDPVLLKSPPPDQSSLRKRPPPPPPSRGPKQQIESPSSSTPPLLHATPDNVAENRSPSSIKQRLAARNPPPVPDLRLDQTEVTDASVRPMARLTNHQVAKGESFSFYRSF
ncbi:hypothetical protein BGW80DRAFT_797104 [Lactifluus volemus]|nr:hypothetical protein BGW80DRAFT_797104 [Lactifluus volemus]